MRKYLATLLILTLLVSSIQIQVIAGEVDEIEDISELPETEVGIEEYDKENASDFIADANAADDLEAEIVNTVSDDIVEEDNDSEDTNEVSAGYNASAAVSYARNNANSSKELCAGFVSKCLQAGGVSIYHAGVGDLYRKLKSIGFTEYTLSYNWPTVTTGKNPGKKISVGDVIIYKNANPNSATPYCHAAIITKIDSSGKVYITQTNGAYVDTVYSAGYKNDKAGISCQAGNIIVYCMHYDGGSTSDTFAPSISNVTIEATSNNAFKVSCRATDESGISKVEFPTWTVENDQDDLIWHAGKQSGDTWYATVRISDHNYEYGRYITHIYAYDKYNNLQTYGISFNVMRNNVWDGDVLIHFEGSAMSKGPGKIIDNGLYYIGSNLSGTLGLDISGDTYDYSDGRNVQVYNNYKNPYDAFYFEYLNNGFYSIKQVKSGKAITVEGGKTTDGANVVMSTYTGATNQQWAITVNGDDRYRISSRCNGKALDVANSGTGNGTNVSTYYTHSANNQRWKFESVPALKATASSGKITSIDRQNGLYRVDVSFHLDSGIIDRVEFPTWTLKNGQDDLKWHKGSFSDRGNGYYDASYTVNISGHNSERGDYRTDVYVYDANTKGSCVGTFSLNMDLPKPTLTPTPRPTSKPTTVPTTRPTSVPTTKPTSTPTTKPTSVPTATPTSVPIPEVDTEFYKEKSVGPYTVIYSKSVEYDTCAHIEVGKYAAGKNDDVEIYVYDRYGALVNPLKYKVIFKNNKDTYAAKRRQPYFTIKMKGGVDDETRNAFNLAKMEFDITPCDINTLNFEVGAMKHRRSGTTISKISYLNDYDKEIRLKQLRNGRGDYIIASETASTITLKGCNNYTGTVVLEK